MLIFGASGFVGRELKTYFEGKGETVVGTYCSNPRPGLKPFDLRQPDLAALVAERLTPQPFAIICSAATDMDRCNREWDRTYAVNVEGTIELASQLQNAGVVPVFLSTDYVYDGSQGDYDEDAPTKPVLAYGRQKKEVEDFLLGTGRPYIVVRAARIYSLQDADRTLLTSIIGSLRRSERIRMATDQIFNPSYVQDVCRAIDLLMTSHSFGCHNLGPEPSLSRFQLATLLKEQLEIKTGQIVPCLLADIPFGDRRPRDTSLSSKRFVQATGLEFTTIDESVARLMSATS